MLQLHAECYKREAQARYRGLWPLKPKTQIYYIYISFSNTILTSASKLGVYIDDTVICNICGCVSKMRILRTFRYASTFASCFY